MKSLKIIFSVVAVAVIGSIAFAYSGLYNVGAADSHGGIVSWLLTTTSHASIERRADDIDVPDLDDESLVLAGVNDFNSMCAGCHGAPGKHPEAMGVGLNPAAPDLAESAAHMSPAELFWVTKNGIKMTGMPSWGASHEDELLWPVVAFMTELPGLDADSYNALLARAGGAGHHGAAGADHDDDVTSADSHSHGEVAVEHDMTAPHHATESQHDPAASETESAAHSHGEVEQPVEEASHDDGHDHSH